MNSKIICFASAKGGSGKTIVSISLTKFLAGLGKKVLIADMDAATNGLSLFYLDELNKAKKYFAEIGVTPHGIFEVSSGELPTIFKIDEATDMIPATYTLKQTEGVSPDYFRKSISKTLSAIGDNYNYIILDAQAGSDIYAQIAIENANEVVIVTEYDPISNEGVLRLLKLFEHTLTYDKTKILFNKLLPEIARSKEYHLALYKTLSPIPWDVEVVRKYVRRKSAVDMEKGSDFTIAIMRTAYSLLGEEIEADINRWKETTEESIRKPTQNQLEEIKNKILSVEKAKTNTEYKMRDLRQKSRDTFTTISMIILGIVVGSSVFLANKGFTFQTITTIITLFVTFVVIFLFYFTRSIERSSRKEEEILTEQLHELDLILEEFKERRQKLRTLVESDFETLLRERGF